MAHRHDRSRRVPEDLRLFRAFASGNRPLMQLDLPSGTRFHEAIAERWLLVGSAPRVSWVTSDVQSLAYVRDASVDGVLCSSVLGDLNRRFIWMGKWIRRGYYPSWILRLFRHGKARCEDRAINEQMIVDGEVGYLKNDFIHEDR